MDIDRMAKILTPTIKSSLADGVTMRLREAIMHGHLTPDEPLREIMLSKLLGISRGPIREALTRLEREGLVIVTSTRRTYVARLSSEDLDEVFTLRKAFERLAVEYACRSAKPEDVDKMQAVLNTIIGSAKRVIDEKEAAEWDLEFHDALYSAGGNKRLLKHWAMIRSQVYVLMLSRNVASKDFRDIFVTGHQKILNAIKAGEVQKALDAIDEHMFHAYNLVKKSYMKSVTDRNGRRRSAAMKGP